MTDKQTLANLNRLSRQAFVEQFGGIFEHASWVAEKAYLQGPFGSVKNLQKTMFDIVLTSSINDRLTLIRNHPELAGKEADEGTLTTDSLKEQSRAGLNQCTVEELTQLRDLNKNYLDKFGFPFVIAVSGLNKHQIIAAMQARLNNDNDIEFNTSIDEIGKIALIRLGALIEP